ncbi:MAG: helix-turn-helix domain-containing protein [Lachnospira sp.]
MVEFGEQLKKAREGKGMTQQSFAEKIYVTRQTVSRWESGVRYPDLHTAKKISEVLNVSIDELLSGEEIKENIDKIPVLDKTYEIIIQTVIYAIALFSYILMSYFSWSSVAFIDESLKNTPAGKIDIITLTVLMKYTITAVILLVGMIWSAKRELTPKKIGAIMSIPYIFSSMEFLVSYINMSIKNNGYIQLSGWIIEFVLPIVSAAFVFVYFTMKKTHFSFLIIAILCMFTMAEILYGYSFRFSHITELGFVVGTVHCVGRIGIVMLLGYQSFILEKKRHLAIVK